MTWLAGVVYVTVSDPGAEPVAMSCLQFQKVESEDGTYALDTGPVVRPAKRKETVATELTATPLTGSQLVVVVEVGVKRAGRPKLSLRDELVVTEGGPVTRTEGPLSVTVSLAVCEESRSCLDVVHAAAETVCGA